MTRPDCYVRKIWGFEVYGVANVILQDEYSSQPECLYGHNSVSI